MAARDGRRKWHEIQIGYLGGKVRGDCQWLLRGDCQWLLHVAEINMFRGT